MWWAVGFGFWTLFCVGFGWWLRGTSEWQKANNTTVIPPILERRKEPEPDMPVPLSEEP
jgi:hypothetical protein